MNPYRMGPPSGWWPPKMNPMVVRLARSIRRRMRRRDQRLLEVTVNGLDHLRQAMSDSCGVLITPNHPSHADPYTMYEVADQLPSPFYFMATWHVFDSQHAFGQWALQRHGIFSVDREGTDLKAFREAVRILQQENHPLVIFPEGEIYHCNDHVTPFREGPATIALSAARRAKRPVVCVPCALKYEYINDPTQDLLDLMADLEQQIHWRPKLDKPLTERIYAFAEAMLSLKEMEYLNRCENGPIPERVKALSERILQRVAARHEFEGANTTIPEQIKELRRRALEKLGEVENDATSRTALNHDLEDLFLTAQLFSYPGDYVAKQPSVERLAETLDKFEEDVMHKSTATIRGTRRAFVYLDEPIAMESGKRSKSAVSDLTDLLESRVQAMLDSHASDEPVT